MQDTDLIPDCYKQPILVLGCGNILFGDDGFGPAVIEYLQKNYKVPEHVCVMDTGTGVREILFNIVLSRKRPEKIIIVDSVDLGPTRQAGEIFEVSTEDMPKNKINDFSLHQVPTSNLLRELQELCKVEVIIIACQIESIPEMVEVGLSKNLIEAIPEACKMIIKKLKLKDDNRTNNSC